MKVSHRILRSWERFRAWGQNFYFDHLQWQNKNAFIDFPPQYLTDILDQCLKRIRGGKASYNEISSRVYGNGTTVNAFMENQLYIALRALEEDGNIFLKDNYYHVTYKGELFFEETFNSPYHGRPYRLHQVRRKLKSIWLFVKIVAAIANALAIIYLGWLQINGGHC